MPVLVLVLVHGYEARICVLSLFIYSPCESSCAFSGTPAEFATCLYRKQQLAHSPAKSSANIQQKAQCDKMVNYLPYQEN